jgi:NAD(P)-dependent dehydrogenase (short-subunit alcohol dehydrogenase family)
MMRIFLTGASGFIGSRILQRTAGAGHQVTGLARSEASALALQTAGAEVQYGTLEAPDSLLAAVARCDAVIHTAFDHDFSRFVENCEKDHRVILAMGAALQAAGGRSSSPPAPPWVTSVTDYPPVKCTSTPGTRTRAPPQSVRETGCWMRGGCPGGATAAGA